MADAEQGGKSTLRRMVLLRDLVGELVADTEAAAEALRSGRPRGPVLGFQCLDKHLGGYLAPGLHIIQGAPGDGKTALALQAAATCRTAALYVSAEMPLLELFRRLIARETRTLLPKLRSGELGPREAEQLAGDTVRRLPAVALVDSTREAVSPGTVTRQAHCLLEITEARHVLVVIDSLTVWARGMTDESGQPIAATEYDQINAGIKAVLAIASALRAPVLALSHRNRVGNRAKPGDAGLHAGKGSGDLEYAAETVLDLTVNKDEGGDREMPAALTILKNRHGRAGVTLRLRFDGLLQTFTEAE